MKKDRPDHIVYSEEQGYTASLLPYATIEAETKKVLALIQSIK